jgi:hypothetical protein
MLRWRAGLLAFLFVAMAMSARAATGVPAGPRQEALCAQAATRAEERHPEVPRGLLLTIGRVESGRPDASGALQPWPWTINADGEGLFFASKEAAVAWARDGLLRGVRFMDVGCMQVDLQMHPGAFASLEEAFDPTANAAYAARFLSALHAGPARGNWYVAIGMYHSQTPALAADYRAAVAAVGLGLRPPAFGGLGGEGRGRARMRVVLANGDVTLLGVHAQPARIHRTVSACRIAAVLGSYLRAPPRCARG